MPEARYMYGAGNIGRGVAACIVFVAATCLAADWPCYRGPNRDGVSTELIAKWPPKELWRASIGKGVSQIVVRNGRVYTMGWVSGQEYVYCFSETPGSATPSPLWTNSYSCADNTYAPYSTPAVDGTNVYTYSDRARLGCFDATTGVSRWSRTLNSANVGGYGAASSPLIEGMSVIVNAGSRGAAVDKTTGALLWGDDAKFGGYASPIALTHAGQRTILVHASPLCSGVNPANGNTLWSFSPGCSYADPVFHNGQVWATTLSGAAIVTNLSGGVSWSGANCGGYNCYVLYEGHLYGTTSSGFKCIEFATGTEKWSIGSELFGSGSSVFLAKDQLVILSGDGNLAVANATPAGYQEAYRTNGIIGATLTCPTLANGRLYVRNNSDTLVCFDVSGGPDWNGIHTDTARVLVQEGGFASIRVRLAKQPAADTTVAIARAGGDTDVSVQTGASLVFTPENWSVWQTATLGAAEDADFEDGVATVVCSASGLDAATVTVTEIDNDTTTATLTVLSGGNGSTSPSGATSVTRNVATAIVALPDSVYAFSNWTVTSGSAVFGNSTAATTTVTIATHATVQANFKYNGTTLTVTSDGHGTTSPSGSVVVGKDVPVSIGATPNPGYAFLKWTGGAIFSNAFAPTTTASVSSPLTIQAVFTNSGQVIVASIPPGYSLSVNEGRNATFYVKLLAPPATNVVVSVGRASGDTDITVVSGASLTFGPANWHIPQAVTLAAAEDDDATYGSANIVCSASGWASATVIANESENDTTATLTVNASTGGTTAPSGTSTVVIPWTSDFNLQRPIGINATANAGYAFLNWTTTTPNYARIADSNAASTTVKITYNSTIQANFVPSGQRIVTDVAVVGVPEGGTAVVQVKLASAPAANLTVSVARQSGDTNVTVVSGSSLTFTPANWGVYQVVTLAASGDDDVLDGSAIVSCAASNWIGANVTATEADDDTILTVSAGAGGSTTPVGSRVVRKNEPTGISAAASSGYAFVGWKVASGSATLGDAGATNTTVAIGACAKILASFSLSDLNGDPDRDGMSNIEEALAGTDPNDPSSRLAVSSPGMSSVTSNAFVVEWQSVTDRTYAVLAATNLLTGFNIVLGTNIPATPTMNVYTDTVQNVGQKYYRVKVE